MVTTGDMIVAERSSSNDEAHVPDLPECVATNASIEETKRRFREAIELDLQGLREDGLRRPEPSIIIDLIEIPA